MFIKLPEKEKKENNRNYIYRTLKNNIMQLYLKPGEIISETELSGFFNVSRTPIREAFIKLLEDKLVEIYPQKGSFVSHIDLKIVQEGIFMRNVLEKAVLKEAIQNFSEEDLNELKKIVAFQRTLSELNDSSIEFFNFDNKFHETIFKGCGKARIWGVVDNMSTHFNRLRFLDTIEKMNTDKILEQHNEIINIIEEKKEEKIDEIVDAHLTNIMVKLDELRKKYSSYFINEI